MTGLAADDAEKVAQASRWLDDTPHDQRDGRTLPALRQRFGLTTKQAIDAIREHNLRMSRGLGRPNAE